MDSVVAITFWQETYKEKQNDLHIVSVDLEKALASPQIFYIEHQACHSCGVLLIANSLHCYHLLAN